MLKDYGVLQRCSL